MKYLPSILSSLVISLGVGAIVAHAQNYQPLAPLPGTFTGSAGSETTDIATYVSGAIKLLIALGAALAVLFAIIGGTQYVAAGISPDAKSGAKDRITNALIGLAVILTSYLLLNSINPALVNVKFELPAVTERAQVPVTTGVPSTGSWQADSSERQQLLALGISINKVNCASVGQQDCTSVYRLSPSAISKLGELKNSCPGCNITLTGGTEYWLHSTGTRHRPGNAVVDLAKSSALDAKIQTGVSLGQQPACSNLGPAYRLQSLGAGLYVDEGNHWHVCY